MKKTLQSVQVKRFKGITDANLDVELINVFIGANNSGKSTIAQLMHFGVSVMQAIELLGKWGNKSLVSLSLDQAQLLYSPCVDLYAMGQGGTLKEAAESAIELILVLSDGEKITVEIRRGRNGNIKVQVNNVAAARTLAKLAEPYTIYSPGLAGIARTEEYISNGVLLRTIARGDANLVLRNILLRLSEKTDEWNNFLEDLRQLFEGIEIDVAYEKETDEHIIAFVNVGSGRVPIELAGTGVLQAVQILGYVHYFDPSVIILDEPDSHLHPNNQRLLCKLLQGVAEKLSTQVFLTTHSRHVVDALSGQGAFHWVRNGSVESMDQDHDLAVLLDIGALDVKEMLSRSHAKCIVLTEDALTRNLEILLEASDLPMDDTLVLAYYGCTSPHNLRPLLDLIRASNPDSKIIVHQDRDYLTNDEAEKWSKEIRKLSAEPFLPVGVDIESHFLNAAHLAKVNNLPVEDMQAFLDTATDECKQTTIEKYVNGRMDIEKKNGTFGSLNHGQLAANAPGVVANELERYRHSKSVLKTLRRQFQDAKGQNLEVIRVSEHIASAELSGIADKVALIPDH